MAQLSMTFMGSFAALHGGAPLEGFQSNKVRGLLAYLAVEMARPHPRETLAGLLWPDQPEVHAHHSLNQALSNLRSILHDHTTAPPFLIVTPQTLQFNKASDHWLDVREFLDWWGEGRLVDWDSGRSVNWGGGRLANWEGAGQAVDLYGGSFLEGFSLAGCPVFEEWVDLQRERLHRLALEAMHHLADDHARREEFEQALQYAWRQLELDPWLEEAHVQAMRWLALTGRRSEALMQYGVCRRALAQEFGVEPAAATTQLYEQIRDGQSAYRHPYPVAARED